MCAAWFVFVLLFAVCCVVFAGCWLRRVACCVLCVVCLLCEIGFLNCGVVCGCCCFFVV